MKEQGNIFQSSCLEIQACLSEITQYKHNPGQLMKKEPYRNMTSNQNYTDSQKVNQCLKCILMNQFKQAVFHCCLIGEKGQRTTMINSLQTILGFAIAKNQQEELNAPHTTIKERNVAIEKVMEGLYKIIESQKVLSKKEETVLDKAKHLLTIWGGIMPDLRALEGFRDIIRRESNQPESKQQTKQIDEEIKDKLNKDINSLHSSQEQEGPAERTLSVLANMLQVSSQARGSDRLRQIQAAVSALLQQHRSAGHIEDALRAELKQQSLNFQQHIATIEREKQRMTIEYNRLKQEMDSIIRGLQAGSKEKQEQIRRLKAQVRTLSQKLGAEGQSSRLAGELREVYSKFGAADKQQFDHRYNQIMQEYTQVWAILSDISSTINMPNSQSYRALTHMHTLITQLNNIQHKISSMAGQLQRKNVPTSSASTNTCPTYSENMETQTEGQQRPEHGLSMNYFGGNLMDGFSYDENNDSGVGFEQERKFLVKCIEDVEKRPIRMTRLLFRFDPLTEAKNFHKFIDGRPQWVLLIKLTNNYMIAGYSNLALLPGLVNQGPGFLASLTNGVCLFRDERIKESKLVVYDSYFIIFGSSEIRLKVSERKVVSNLGAAHHSFRTKEKSAKILLGIEQKEMDVEQFEIHQIYF